MRRGIEHEFEHTDDVAKSAATACDHLGEVGDYYTRLDKLEDRAKRGLPPNPRDEDEEDEIEWVDAPDQHLFDMSDPEQRKRAEAQARTLAELDDFLEEEGEDFGLKPNRRARGLGKRPAMDTRFGDTVEDPDTLTGARGRHVDSAMDRYETFHAKKPIRIAELDHELPEEWVCVGDANAVMYRTDKWHSDGDDEDYKHLHDKGDDKPYEFRKGVRFYEPAAEYRKSRVKGGGPIGKRRLKEQGLPVSRPRALTLLGYCLGAFVHSHDDPDVEYEVNPRGCYLFSSPSGNMLAIYSPDEQPDGSSGFLAIMAGGNLRVLKDGIDG
jgi:hypothetical protein